ncbi:MAG: hypothetical protein P8M20_00380 [Planctomycetaceae bacterium]|jgi:hypothetical protein|nr:hypothetical protein [Planctomycetaceae bacterium]
MPERPAVSKGGNEKMITAACPVVDLVVLRPGMMTIRRSSSE